MRIVLDTNVALSALLWGGPPYVLLQTIRRREHVQLVAELRSAGARQVKRSFTGSAARSYRAKVARDCSDDDHVIAAAVAAGADLLVSGDRHLLGLKSHQNIRIVSPAEAIQRLGA